MREAARKTFSWGEARLTPNFWATEATTGSLVEIATTDWMAVPEAIRYRVRGGNDSYWIDNPADVVIEAKQGGIDTVHSSIDYVLGPYAENLALEGDAFAGIGNKFDNVITGSDGNNLLSGMIGRDRLEGGSGDDTLIGGRDCDTFVFKPGFGHDVITDFAVSGAYSAVGPGHDVIEFDKSIFAEAEAVFSHIADKVYGLVITDSQGDTLTLYGVDLAKLQAHPEDLHFV